MPTTRYSQPSSPYRTATSAASTLATAAVALGAPIAVFFAIDNRDPITPFHISATVAAFVWLCGLYTFISRSTGTGLPLIVVAPLRRHMLDVIDTSAFGAGALKGWTATNPEVDLAAVAPPRRKRTDTEPDIAPAPAHQPTRQAAPVPTLTAVTHHTRRGDTLWTLAEHYLGDGARWAEIAELNNRRTVAPSVTYPRDNTLSSGWQILIPAAGNNE